MPDYKKPALRLLAVVTMVAIASLMSACDSGPSLQSPSALQTASIPTEAPEPSPAAPESVYENEALGISMVFPAEWENRYIIEEQKSGISVYSKKVREEFEGRLFSIKRMTGELITQKFMDSGPVFAQILLQGNGYTYIATKPSDVQYPPDNEELSAEYKDLYGKTADVYQSLKLLGTKTPEAKNEGYKIIGTDYIEVEIPEDWDLKPSEDTIVCWDIYSLDMQVGSIQIIPYKSEIIGSDDETMREYILNDFHDNLSALITLNTQHADQDIMQKIKSSIVLKGGAPVVYVFSLANRYLELGGIKIFGKIDSFETENGRFKTINIREMQCVPDNSEKGFHIEDLNRIITYPMDYPQFAPLVGPDYETYGTYDYYALDSKTFFDLYPDYKDLYYDFIIGDYMVKVVLGHYVPQSAILGALDENIN